MATITIGTAPSGSPVSNSFESIVSGLRHGVKVGAANQASEVAIQVALNLLGESADVVLENPYGRAAMKLLGAMALSMAADTNLITGRTARTARQAASLVSEAVGRDVAEPLMESIRATLPMLSALESADSDSE
jgi:hypothetical protein